MKKIYLIRHAKSSWKNEKISDFDRDLNKRGEKDAPFMAKRLKYFGITPDIIYSSPAKRAKKTAKIFAKILDYKKEDIIFLDRLYDADISYYFKIIRGTNNKFDNLFIFGHNPTITEVGEILSNSILTNMPTCSIVCITFDIDNFKLLKENQGKIDFFDYPKKHRK